MKKKFTKCFLLVLSILVLIFATSCSKNTNKEKLIIATNDMFPPFVYRENDSNYGLVGFDIELIKEIAKDLNREYEIRVMEFNKLIPAVENGYVDMAICGITITDERKSVVEFSTPYHKSSRASIVQRKYLDNFKDIKTKESLGESKRLAAQVGTTGSAVAHEIAKGRTVVNISTPEFVLMELLSENVDAVIMDRGLASAYASKYSDFVVLPINFDSENYGVAVSKDDALLLASVNKTLTRLINSGEYINLANTYINTYLSK